MLSMLSISSRILAAVASFSIPPVTERKKFTFITLPLYMVKYLPPAFAAHIRLRFPNTTLSVRVIIFLIGIPVICRVCFGYYFFSVWNSADGIPLSIAFFNVTNDGMQAACMTLKLFELLFLGKDEDYEVRDAKEYRLSKGMQGPEKGRYTIEKPANFPGTNTWIEWDMITTLRGAGYNWGMKDSKAGYKAILESEKLAQIDPTIAAQRKWSIIKGVALSALVSWTIMDVLDSILKSPLIFPPVGRLGGGPLSEATQGILGWLGPYAVTLMMGIMIVASFQALFATTYLIALIFTTPSEIPITKARWMPAPLDRPYISTSLSELWSIRWHSNLRRQFMLFAYKPVRCFSKYVGLPSKVGQGLAVIATFALSGLLHEFILEGQVVPFYSKEIHTLYDHKFLGKETKPVQSQYGTGAKMFTSTYAFTIQGVIVVLEDVWLNMLEEKVVKLLYLWSEEKAANGKLLTGRLRSFLGWLWMMTWMMYSGHLLVDIWLLHGSLNSVVSCRWAATLFHFVRPYFTS